jgi:hypothetical protein
MAARPFSTTAWRTRGTVAAMLSPASALSAAVQWRSPTPPSAWSRIRAWSRLAAAARPVFTKAHHCARASALRRTRYVPRSALRSGVPPPGEPMAENLSSELW